MIVPFAGGSASDVVTRIMLNKMSQNMGQTIIVENRPGAGGNIGTAMGAKAAPDGYTWIASGSGPIAANKTLYRELGYDPEKDFEAVSPFAYFTIVVAASTQLPVKTLQELIAYAKQHPGELNYGSVGIGSSQHLGGAYFEQITGTKLTHVSAQEHRPAPAPDMIAGTVLLGFQRLPNVSCCSTRCGARVPWRSPASQRLAALLGQRRPPSEAGLPDHQASGWFAMQRTAPEGTSCCASTRRWPRRSTIRDAALRRAAGRGARRDPAGSGRQVRQSDEIAGAARHHREGRHPEDRLSGLPRRSDLTARSTAYEIATVLTVRLSISPRTCA